MPTDLELREAVAVKVLGLDKAKLSSHDGPYNAALGVKEWRPTLCYKDPLCPPPATRVVPEYESNIAAAWQVVEKMRERGFCFQLEYGPGPSSVCYATFTKAVLHVRCEERCLPAPRAICEAALAALKAMESGKE